MAFLQIDHVEKRFGSGAAAVAGVTLDVERGEFVSFLGPSGCGKTTTLRMIAGFERPTAGRIVIDGEDVTDRPPNKRNIGMVFQSYALFPNMTVAANIGYGLRIRHVDRKRIAGRVDELLSLINLEGRGDRYPWQLSGGQQQRVALARALAIEPQVLLLDEPLSALDAKIRLSLRQEIRQIQRKLGITTIYVTHDQEEALSLSDRVVVMNEGRVEQVGPPPQVYGQPETGFVARFIGHLNVLNARAVDPAGGTVLIGDQLVQLPRALQDTAAGEEVQLAIRPESMRLHDGIPGANLLRGTIEDVTFLGATVRIRLRLGDGTTVLMDSFNDAAVSPPSPQSDVTVSFPSSAVLMLHEPTANPDAASMSD
jgi:putative spermidine/putrescine transport system ATP-binding protein